MGRLREAAMECSYKEVDRQLKAQFIRRLNDSEIVTEITRELTEIDENVIIQSEHVLTWAKQVEVQRAQVAVINRHELRNFDTILQMDKGKQRDTISHTCENMCKKKMQILWSGPQTAMVPSIWEDV